MIRAETSAACLMKLRAASGEPSVRLARGRRRAGRAPVIIDAPGAVAKDDVFGGKQGRIVLSNWQAMLPAEVLTLQRLVDEPGAFEFFFRFAEQAFLIPERLPRTSVRVTATTLRI